VFLARAALALCAVVLLLTGCVTAEPERVSARIEIGMVVWQDHVREEFPVEVLWPADREAIGLVMFSHGAFSGRYCNLTSGNSFRAAR